nr:LLM class flavin-dependent oxidoreductase [Frankia sp. QA3]
MSVIVLPLYDVLRAAEDLAVLDVISDGRLEVVVGAGYRPAEYAMFGRSFAGRGSQVEDAVPLLRRAWSGEPFDHRGTTVRVTPVPVHQPGPPVLLGGSSPAAARRAARGARRRRVRADRRTAGRGLSRRVRGARARAWPHDVPDRADVPPRVR